MSDEALNIISNLETLGLLEAPDDVAALMRGLPLLGCCDGEVRWSPSAEIRAFEPPEDWHPSLRFQMFGGNMYGDFWCFQPTVAHPTAVTFVTHDLDEATCFAPSFEMFLFRSVVNALVHKRASTWRAWSLDEVVQIMKAGVAVVGSLIPAELTARLEGLVAAGPNVVVATEKRQRGYFSWLTQAEADQLVAEVAGWGDLDRTFQYSRGV